MVFLLLLIFSGGIYDGGVIFHLLLFLDCGRINNGGLLDDFILLGRGRGGGGGHAIAGGKKHDGEGKQQDVFHNFSGFAKQTIALAHDSLVHSHPALNIVESFSAGKPDEAALKFEKHMFAFESADGVRTKILCLFRT
jgi:hypothetical protein